MLKYILAAAFASWTAQAIAAPVLDFSGTPPGGLTDTGFVYGGGVQFVSSKSFTVGAIEILLGGRVATDTFELSILTFDGGLGDTTATAILGTVSGVTSGGQPYADFALDAASADFSAQRITLEAGSTYGVVVGGVTGSAADVVGGSGGGQDTYPSVGALFNGSTATLAYQFVGSREVPFRISATNSVSVPSSVLLIVSGVVLLSLTSIRAAPKQKVDESI